MNQQNDNTTQNDQQYSWYYNSYSTSNFAQQSQDHQNQQSREQQAGHSNQASWYFDRYASHNNYHNPNYEQQQQQQQQQQPIAQSNEQAAWYFDANPSSSYQECRQAQQQQPQPQQQQRSDPYSYYYHNDYANNNYNVLQNQDRASWYNQQQTMENATTSIPITTTTSSAVATPIPTMTYPVTSDNNENKEKQESKQHDRSSVQPMETEINLMTTNDTPESNQHLSAAPALSKDTELMVLLDSENSVGSISDDESGSDNNNDKYEMEESEDNEDEDEDEDDWMNHDSDSVASYNTATEEPTGFVEDDEDDEDNENNATLLSDIHSATEKIEWKMGEYFMNLIEECGKEPGMGHMEGPLEQHDIKLPGSTNMFFEKAGNDKEKKKNKRKG